MKKVITYGSFDLFHEGHYKLLKRAKELGDYLIVGVTTEHFDESRGKLDIIDPIMKRVENVQKTGFADMIIIEDHDGQKISDIQKYGVDIFTVGSDWVGYFDYLKAFCEVVYLPRTPNISSTSLRKENQPLIRMGIIGCDNNAVELDAESKYVSCVQVNGCFDKNSEIADRLAKRIGVDSFGNEMTGLLDNNDAVYINCPTAERYQLIMECLKAGKHVISEAPVAETTQEVKNLYELAREKNLILLEAIKTAFFPGFLQLNNIIKSGKIGEIIGINLSVSDISNSVQKAFVNNIGTASLPIIKLLGSDFEGISCDNVISSERQFYSVVRYVYRNSYAIAQIGSGISMEDQMVIIGTKGRIVAEAPWWTTQKIRIYSSTSGYEEYTPRIWGTGMRYEISEFASMIHNKSVSNYKVSIKDSLALSTVIEKYKESID